MKVSFDNYRFFDESMEFSFSPITILTGSNSSGKSSLTYALRLFKDGFKDGKITLTKLELMKIGSAKKILNNKNENVKNEIVFNYTYDNYFSIFPKFKLKTKYIVVNETDIILQSYVIVNTNTNNEFFNNYLHNDESDNIRKNPIEKYSHFFKDADMTPTPEGLFLDLFSLDTNKVVYSDFFYFFQSYEKSSFILKRVLGKGDASEKNIIENHLNNIYEKIIYNIKTDFENVIDKEAGIYKEILKNIASNQVINYSPFNILELIVYIYQHGGLGFEPFEDFIKPYYMELYNGIGYNGSFNTNLIHDIIEFYYIINDRFLPIGFDGSTKLKDSIHYEWIRRYIKNADNSLLKNNLIDIEEIKLADDYHTIYGIEDIIHASNIECDWYSIFPEYKKEQVDNIKEKLKKEFGYCKYDLYYIFKIMEEYDTQTNAELFKIDGDKLAKKLVLNLKIYGKSLIENKEFKNLQHTSSLNINIEYINQLIKNIEINISLFKNCFNKATKKLFNFFNDIKINYHPNVNIHLDKRYVELLDTKNFLSEILEKYYSIKNSSSDEFIKKWIKEFNIGDDFNFFKDEQIVKLYIYKDGKEFLLNDEGMGIGKLFPIILHIATLGLENHNNFLIIEEPESNLHPKLQSKLADLFLDAYNKFGLKFIIETHSEYIIRKLQYLVAKDKGVSNLNGDINIYYFYHPREIPQGEKQVFQIKITQDGRLTKNFGKGFLDEASDLSMLLFQSSIN